MITRKFLSIRDKGGVHNRSKSAPPGGDKPRPMAPDSIRFLFKGTKRDNNKGDKEKEDAKIKDVQGRLDELGITNVSVEHIKDIMTTRFAEGDAGRAVEFIDIEQKASTGTIIPYDPKVDMVGAENRSNVTCYLDALLFAMFAKMDAFECILKTDFPEQDSRSRLVTLLRIWVNMLRSGKLIRTDLTRHIQEALAECGWSDARELEQQDTSEAFAFLTETLQLPLLSLQVDLFHQGKGDKDDHKVVYERLLNLAVPEDPDGDLTLEDCLEEYFNTQVDVMRDSEEAKKTISEKRRHSVPSRSTIQISTQELSTPDPIISSPLAITPATPTANGNIGTEPVVSGTDTLQVNEDRPAPTVTFDADTPDPKPPVPRRPGTRDRSSSVIQSFIIDEKGRKSRTEDETMLQKARRKGSTVVKAVTIPAWQFFRLVPWNALDEGEPMNNTDVAMNFEKRPVVGICLKRYAMDSDGYPKRHNTHIDIPDSLRLPRFMMPDDSSGDETSGEELNTDYKLVLQSIVCHRGDSLQSGHYIAFARVDPKLLVDNRRHNFDPPPDYEEARWVRFDDLELGGRVTYVDDIKQSMKDEMPYLLFYQVVPMVNSKDADAPPNYDDFKVSVEFPSPSPARNEDVTTLRMSNSHAGYFGDSAPLAGAMASAMTGTLSSPPSKPPSIRLSSEMDRPRQSVERRGRASATASAVASPRNSINWADSPGISPGFTTDVESPIMSPGEESTATRIARAANRFRGKNSRPVSQTGEGRVSSAVFKMAGLMIRQSKDPLVEPSGAARSTPDIQTGARRSSEVSPEAEVSIEADKGSDKMEGDVEKPKTIHEHKKGKSKDKPKEKVTKGKDEEPERECAVM